MPEALGFDQFSLSPSGPTLTMSIPEGSAVAVVGPAESGKSLLLDAILGERLEVRGRVEVTGTIVTTDHASPRRSPRRILGREAHDVVSRVLMVVGLGERRQTPIAELSSSQAAAARLLPILSADRSILLVDGELDRLDPWTLARVWEQLVSLRREGSTLIFATHRPDLVARCDALIVLHDRRIRFAGSVDDLLRDAVPSRLEVVTDRRSAARALVEPFTVTVTETPEGLRMEASEGQAIAAKLLLEGYGEVRSVTLRRPTVEEALFRLV